MEQEKTLYRKYRPSAFSEVRGQDHIVTALQGALRKKTIAHAYLFAGSRGIGKTSIARILAREMGCSSNDLYEIDAASNRGIDDIRELRESVQVLPLESPYKVYIIDEVHMLTKEAFNALLKTLEEPPAHAVFMLATTEIEKLPETIVSRCQTFFLKKPSVAVLKKLVEDVAQKEGRPIESSAAGLVAMLGDGSFRDTLGMLQKIFAATEGKVASQDVEKIAGVPPLDLVVAFVEAVAKKDASQAIEVIARVIESNLDITVFAMLVVRTIRAVLLLRVASKEGEVRRQIEGEFPDEVVQSLARIAEQKEAAITSSTLKTFLMALGEMKFVQAKELPLEAAVLSLATED